MASAKQHVYAVQVQWTGNQGTGTSAYTKYSRAHEIRCAGKPIIVGSSDPAFRGDRGRYNPEELLVASLSTCHMLWYLHLCTDAGVVVTDYKDSAVGTMLENNDGSGCFSSVTLKPVVTVASGAHRALARALHRRAHEMCFIASSVRFPVLCEPTVLASGEVS